MKKVAVGRHNFFQKWILDPLEGGFVLALLGLFRVMPLNMARRVGRGLGRFVGMLMRQRNAWAMYNLNIAFPKKSHQEKKKIIQGMWAHFGQFAAEIPHNRQVMAEAKITGIEFLQKAYQSGKGGFICSAHFGNWELPFYSYVAPDFEANPVFRKANNWVLDQFLFEKRPGVKIPKGTGGARIMIDLLKQGKFITILCDQKLKEGITVPLWHRPAQTAGAMASLAIKMNLPIIMVKGVFDGKRYHITFYSPLALPKTKEKSKGEYQVMLQVNQMYEKWFAENPDQVLWIHRRFDKHLYPNY